MMCQIKGFPDLNRRHVWSFETDHHASLTQTGKIVNIACCVVAMSPSLVIEEIELRIIVCHEINFNTAGAL